MSCILCLSASHLVTRSYCQSVTQSRSLSAIQSVTQPVAKRGSITVSLGVGSDACLHQCQPSPLWRLRW